MSKKRLLNEHLLEVGHSKEGDEVSVNLDRSLAPLLSEQLYRSPLKALEELVVNSYDADARECRLFVPAPSDIEHKFALVYDNGHGMDRSGLTNLWQIGRSPKSESRNALTRLKRKQIGKFGIGKLAAYAIARQLTYVSKAEEILAVSINFDLFGGAEGSKQVEASAQGVRMPIIEVKQVDDLRDFQDLAHAMEHAGVAFGDLESSGSWTIAFLERFKPEKAEKLKLGYLERVLSSAMPLRHDFTLWLNAEEIRSSKEEHNRVVEFTVGEFAREHLDSLRKSMGEDWRVEKDSLYSSNFPSGISGSAFVTGNKRLTGKSSDLFRSHGFFIKVRGRLINADDPLFGMRPLSHRYFNRFRAEIDADDLDRVLTAPREGVEDSKLEEIFQELIRKIFNYARRRRDQWQGEQERGAKTRKEEERSFISPSLVEYPVADVMASYDEEVPQADADHSWFYLDLAGVEDRAEIVKELYRERIDEGKRRQYQYVYEEQDESRRLVSFNPSTACFKINTRHEFVREHYENGSSHLLEDIVTAEALLEIYLRENGVSAEVIGEILERRDFLLRCLAMERPYSLESLAQELRDAASDQWDLEIALVSAARRLGFIAKHISGKGRPDGIARFNDYSKGEEVRIILEAKSSSSIPKLGALDYAGLLEHMERQWEDSDGEQFDAGSFDGCLLVAPEYPGMSREDDSAASWRANRLRISCWTVDQLAQFVASAEKLHLAAEDLLGIVLEKFTPREVSNALEEVLGRRHIGRSVYLGIVKVLREIEEEAQGEHGNVPEANSLDFIYARMRSLQEMQGIKKDEVRKALSEVASASQGGLLLRGERNERVVVRASLEEIERRISGLTRRSGSPRRPSSFQ